MKKRKSSYKVNPWEVSGEIDYEKIMKEFGVKKLSHLPQVFNKNILFRRGVVFAHRDFGRIVDAIEKKKKFIMMTGLMPSGKFHLGHMIVALQMVFYQKLGAKIYIAVADLEAYNARGKSLKELRKTAVEEYLSNYVALGLNLNKADVYFQSDRSKDYKKSNAYYRLASKFARYATFNEFKAVYGNITPGKMNASLLQASDMFHAQLKEFEGKCPVVVPVGIDQDPHLRLARDIGSRDKDDDFVQLSSTYHVFFPSLRGEGKMSSSDENSYIALTDSPREIERKIKKYAFSGGKDTLEEHRKKGGNPEVDVSFQYLRMFFEEDDKKLEKIYNDYKSGKMLTSELKQILIDKMTKFAKEYQKKLIKARKQVEKYLK